jgi:hypothetical protein
VESGRVRKARERPCGLWEEKRAGQVCERVYGLRSSLQRPYTISTANYREKLQVDSIGLSYQKHVDKAA